MIDWHDDSTKIQQWSTLLNDVFGVVSFTMAVTAILSPYPSEVATFSIFFISLWSFSKGRPFRRPIQRYQDKNGSAKTNIVLLGGSYIFVFGFISLFLVACGAITLDSLKGFSLQAWFFK